MVQKILAFIIGVVLVNVVSAQENNYWSQQAGARSSALCGASTALENDNSSIFYNPGALSFAKLNFVEAQTDVATLDFIRLDNANLDEPIDITAIDAIPQFFGYTNKFKNDSSWSFSYTIMNRSYSFLKFRVHQESISSEEANALDTINVISHNYSNRDRDDWLGFGLSKQINKRWGIGVSTFLTLKSQDFLRETEFLSLQKNKDILYSPRANFSSQQELQLRSTGLIWKVGVFHKTKNTNFGLSITTARLNIPILNNYVRETIYRDVDATGNVLYQNTAYRRKSVYKSPTSVEFGLMQKLSSKHFVYFRTEYFMGIDPYGLIKHNDQKEADAFYYSTPQQAAKSVMNFSVAYEYVINNSMTWMAGFRTDYNYFDHAKLHKTRDFVPSLGFWDLYHLSTGLTYLKNRVFIVGGLNFAFANDKYNPQLVENEIGSEIREVKALDSEFEVLVSRIAVNLGFNFLINRFDTDDDILKSLDD